MLSTEGYAIEASIDELTEQIDALEAEMDSVKQSTEQYKALRQRRDRLAYLRNGLRWQRDEAGWEDSTVELGALTAGEKALMHREAPDDAGREEMRLWFVAASTVSAPYADEDDELGTVFGELANCHPAFAEWAEAKANSLGVPRESGNRSQTSSTGRSPSEASTTEPDSTTSSSSDSPTE